MSLFGIVSRVGIQGWSWPTTVRLKHVWQLGSFTPSKGSGQCITCSQATHSRVPRTLAVIFVRFALSTTSSQSSLCFFVFRLSRLAFQLLCFFLGRKTPLTNLHGCRRCRLLPSARRLSRFSPLERPSTTELSHRPSQVCNAKGGLNAASVKA